MISQRPETTYSFKVSKETTCTSLSLKSLTEDDTQEIVGLRQRLSVAESAGKRSETECENHKQRCNLLRQQIELVIQEKAAFEVKHTSPMTFVDFVALV